MQNDLLGNILNNIVMEKVVRDKIVMQQKQQRQEEARQRKERDRDELDQFQDQQTREIMRKMKSERLRMNQEMPQAHREETRTFGQYREIVESQFLNYVTKLKRTIVHFFHKDFLRCKIMDKHLKLLCQQFPQTQFLCIDVEKTPFFVQKLGIRSLPTLGLFIDGVLKDKVLGFQGLSGDEFLTWQLAARLSQAGVIENPKDKIKDKTLLKGHRPRGKNGSDSESDQN